jgi:hypothetical protein
MLKNYIRLNMCSLCYFKCSILFSDKDNYRLSNKKVVSWKYKCVCYTEAVFFMTREPQWAWASSLSRFRNLTQIHHNR